MPSNTETVKISLPVVPELDKKATSNLIRDIKSLSKELDKVKLSYDELHKKSSKNIQELKKIASESKKAVKSVSSAATSPKASSGAKSFDKSLESAVAAIEGHEKALYSSIKAQKEFARELGKLKADRIEKNLKGALNSIPAIFQAGMSKNLGGLFSVLGSGGKSLKGLFSKTDEEKRKLRRVSGASGDIADRKSMINAVRHGRSSSKLVGSAIRTGGGGGGGGGGGRAVASVAGGGGGSDLVGMMSNLSKFGIAISAAVGGIAVFVKLLSMASDNQVKLNKALVQGTGFSKDFLAGASGYRSSVNEMRDAVQDSAKSLLSLGVDTEGASKAINSYITETGASMSQAVVDFSAKTGKLSDGVSSFVQNAKAYGAALNMDLQETSAFMGKLENELGYSADGSQKIMQNLVKTAATANMPLNKMMSIVQAVTPYMEIYKNRIEEVTMAIKLMSKTMSAKTVQKFTEAFAKGMSGTSFQERIGRVLTAGVGETRDILMRDSEAKIKSLSAQLSGLASEEEIRKAAKGGPKSMAALIADVQAKAAASGKEIQGSTYESMADIGRTRGLIEKGDAASLGTAVESGGMLANYKMVESIMKKFGLQGVSGVQQAAAEKLVTKEQSDAYVKMTQSLDAIHSSLGKFASTDDVYLNKALRDIMEKKLTAQGKPITAENIDKEVRKASDDDIFAAMEASSVLSAADQKEVINVADEQYNMLSTISDKLSNLIAYYLEQILRVLNPIVDYINNILKWIMGDKSGVQKQNALDKERKRSSDYLFGTQAEKKQKQDTLDQVYESLKGNIGSKKTMSSMLSETGILSGENVSKLDKMSDEEIQKMLDYVSGGNKTSAWKAMTSLESIKKARKSGGISGVLKSVDTNFGFGDTEAAMRAATFLANNGAIIQKSGTPQTRSETIQERRAAQAKGKFRGQTTGGTIGKGGAAIGEGVIDGKTTVGGPPVIPVAVQSDISSASRSDEVTKELVKTSNGTAEKTQDVAESLDRGITLNNSWLNSTYKNVIKDATLASFRTALMEYAILDAKIKAGGALATRMAGSEGGNFLAAGLTARDLSYVGSNDSDAINTALGYPNGKPGAPGHATGGPVNYDHLANIHRGEYIVPRGGALAMSGSGGKTVNVGGITVNVHTDANPDQIAQAVHDIFRQQ